MSHETDLGIAATPSAKDLATSVADRLGLSRATQIAKLAEFIAEALARYEAHRAAKARWRPAKEQRLILKRLRNQLLSVRKSIRDLSPEYRAAVGNLTGLPAEDESVDMAVMHDKLGDISVSVREILIWLEPPKGPPSNEGLETAVRVLLPALEELSGQKATIRWNKQKTEQPEPRSASSEALVAIIRGFPSPPSQTAVLNMIDTVRRRPKRNTESVETAIQRFFDELDMSLLPGRKEKPAMGDEIGPMIVSRRD